MVYNISMVYQDKVECTSSDSGSSGRINKSSTSNSSSKKLLTNYKNTLKLLTTF